MLIGFGLFILLYVPAILAGIGILNGHIVVVIICALFGGLSGAILLLLDRKK
jgi:hypothetical protein